MKYFLLSLVALLNLSCGTEFEDRFCPGVDNCVFYRIIFTDNFERNDESPVASPWNHISASAGDDFELLSNVLAPKRGAGDSPSALYTVPIPTRAVKVSVTAAITGANFPAGTPGEIIVLARVQSPTSIADAYFCGIDPTSGVVTLGKNVGGAATFLASSGNSFTLNNGDSFRFNFSLVDSSITCSISETGGPTISASASDSEFSTGYTGVRGGKSGADELTFDNFVVEGSDY